MSDTHPYTERQASLGVGAQIACVKREIAMRERVYPTLIAKGRMKAGDAEYELAAMRAVLATIEGLPG
jgi:hypothetical protein